MLVGVLVLSFVFTSCGNDDDISEESASINSSKIVGYWIPTKTIIRGETTIHEHDCESTSLDYDKYTSSKEYSHVYFDKTCAHGGYRAKWEISGTTLMQKDESSVSYYKIVELTDAIMVLSFQKSSYNGQEEIWDENGDGKPDQRIFYYKRGYKK